MTRTEIQTRVFKEIQSQMNIDIEETDLLDDDLGMDSLDQVELFMNIEKQFGININDVDLIKASTVKDVVDLVEKYLA